MKKRDPILVELGAELSGIDEKIVGLMADRARVVEKVALHKLETGQPLLRPEIEEKRRLAWMNWSCEKNLDPEFGRTLFNVTLAEMCRIEVAKQESAKAKKEAVKSSGSVKICDVHKILTKGGHFFLKDSKDKKSSDKSGDDFMMKI